MNNIVAIPAYTDNYIWLLTSSDKKQACVIDPGQSQAVLAYLQTHSLNLTTILITHSHYDHVNGVKDLCKAFPDCKVYGPALEKFPNKQFELSDGDIVEFDLLRFIVMDIPGHTIGHIAYSCQEEKLLFSGDTLFGIGCGRVQTIGRTPKGTVEQLHQSLNRIAQLPKDTRVYCTHEYTQANLAFAKAVEPQNTLLVEHEKVVDGLLLNKKPTVPLLLKDEIEKNPFLRCHEPSIKTAVEAYSQKVLATPQDVFVQLRLWKDKF